MENDGDDLSPYYDDEFDYDDDYYEDFPHQRYTRDERLANPNLPQAPWERLNSHAYDDIEMED